MVYYVLYWLKKLKGQKILPENFQRIIYLVLATIEWKSIKDASKQWKKFLYKNLQMTLLFGKEKVKFISKQYVKFVKQRTAEGYFYLLHKEDYLNYIKMKDLNLLDKTLKKEKGIILLIPHIGVYFLVPFILSALNYPVNILSYPAEAQKMPFILKLFNLNKIPNIISVKNFLDIKLIFEVLNKKQILCIFPEINLLGLSNSEYYDVFLKLEKKVLIPHTKNFTVDFLNKKIYPNSSLLKLAYKQRTPMLWGIYHVNFKSNERILQIKVFEDFANSNNFSLQEMTQKLYKELEKLILNFPHEWLLWVIFHRIVV